jgi:non-specific protein-tyrosine kinase
LAAGAAFWVSSQQDALYRATSTLLINQGTSSESDLSQIQAGERLSSTYQQLVVTDPVLTAVINRLGLPPDLAALRANVSASAVSGTQILRISVSDTDPQRAAEIANAVADEFARYVSEQTSLLTNPSREALDTQIAGTEQQIEDLNTQIQTLEQQANAADPQVQAQIATLRTSLNQLQVSYGDLLLQRQQMDLSQASAQSRVTVWEYARVPADPYEPRTTLYTALAGFAGLLIAVGGIVLIEYFDNTVKSGDDVKALVDTPILTEVPLVPKLQAGRDQLFVARKPSSSVAEAIRLLRTNLEFAAASQEIATLLITSPSPSEGKSTVAANLATAMAQAGIVTVLVDADLRRPSQHKIFEIPSDRGLTTLLTHPEWTWNWAAAEVIPGQLFVIPSGPLPPNPADLLGSSRLTSLLRSINQSVDLVIVDSPPLLAATDALIVAPNTDGVVVVCRPGLTRQDMLRRAVTSLQQGNIRLLGVVLNARATRGEPGYYYGYYYATETDNLGSPNGTQDQSLSPRSTWRTRNQDASDTEATSTPA